MTSSLPFGTVLTERFSGIVPRTEGYEELEGERMTVEHWENAGRKHWLRVRFSGDDEPWLKQFSGRNLPAMEREIAALKQLIGMEG